MSGRIERSGLGLGLSLAAGSQGAICSVARGGELGLGSAPLIEEEFAARTGVSGAAFGALARVRAGMSEQERAVIDRYRVWPIEVVVDDGPQRELDHR